MNLKKATRLEYMLLVALLLLLMGNSFYQPVQLGAPPSWPASPAAGGSHVAPLAEGDLFLFLPLVSTNAPQAPDARQTAVALWTDEYLPSENVSDSGWTGNHDSCDPGDTNQVYKDAIFRRINYFRVAAGVPALTGLNPDFNQKAQAAALMMSRNNRLSHAPGVPPEDDPSNWLCFSTAGQDAAGSSNLALGINGPGVISAYMQDYGNGNEHVAHRRWILYPNTQQMGTGDIPTTGSYWSSNALYIFDEHIFDPRPTVRDDFVAWPPKGYIPYQVVYQRWSFSYPDADFSGAQARVTQNGVDQPLALYPLYVNYGENTLVWEMSAIGSMTTHPKPDADTTYVVTVQNVMVNGQARDFTYDVIIIDPDS